MVKKDKIKRGGEIKTFVSVVEGYRPAPGAAPKQRMIKSFGYLEDQEDPESFMEMVRAFNETYREENAPLNIEASGTAQMYGESNRKYNYGYKYLEAVYDLLGIDEYINEHLNAIKYQGEYSPAEIFKFLVLLRILAPESKRASFQMKEGFYGKDTNFDLQDIYRSLDVFSGFEVPLQRHLNEEVKKTIGRDLSHAFIYWRELHVNDVHIRYTYDVTNYFFEIDFPDGEDDLRKRGVSKEHRVDPITAMGLFIDGNGLPVSMSMIDWRELHVNYRLHSLHVPGNTSDSLTLQATMKDVKESYGLGRIVVVADKGLNSSSNINATVNNGDGFVFSQILKGTKGQRYVGKVLDAYGWRFNEDETYKYKLFEEEYDSKDENGKKVIRKRKVLIYWNKTEADMAKRKREEKLERVANVNVIHMQLTPINKAAKSVKNNAYSIKKGVDEYTKDNVIDKETGELLENIVKQRSIDSEKAEKDSLYDGYFCIITSELDYDERKMREVYGGLWRIEQSFRIMKSDLYARPVFVSKNERTCDECERSSHAVHANQSRAHFLICFVALLIIRIIQHRMGNGALSAERIARALNAATCRVFKGGVVHLDDVGGAIAFKKRIDKTGKLVDTLEHTDQDEIALDYKMIQNLFGTNCYNIYHRVESFNKFLNSIVVS